MRMALICLRLSLVHASASHPPEKQSIYCIAQPPVSPVRSGTIYSVLPIANPTNPVIYTAATVLLGARLCLKNEEIADIREDWNLALDYLKTHILKIYLSRTLSESLRGNAFPNQSYTQNTH